MSRRSRDPSEAALAQISGSSDAASLAADIRAAREAGASDDAIRARIQGILQITEENEGTYALLAFMPRRNDKTIPDATTLWSLYPDLRYVGSHRSNTEPERVEAIAAVFASIVVRNEPIKATTNLVGLNDTGKKRVFDLMGLRAPPPPTTRTTAVAVGKAAPAAADDAHSGRRVTRASDAAAPNASSRSASVSASSRAAPATNVNLGNWSNASSMVAAAATNGATAVVNKVAGAASVIKGVTPSVAEMTRTVANVIEQTKSIYSDYSSSAASADEPSQPVRPSLPVQSSSTGGSSGSKAMTVDQIVTAMDSFRLDDAENAQEMAKLTRAIRALQNRLHSVSDRRVLGVKIRAGENAMVLPLAALVLYD